LDEMREVAHGAEIVTKKARVGRRDVWRSGKSFLVPKAVLGGEGVWGRRGVGGGGGSGGGRGLR
jgi:hypothetical protein